MQNLMIIDSDFIYIQKLINKISNTINNLRLYNFSSDITDSLECIICKEIDIIIINVEFDIISFIEFITQNKLDIYDKSIILLYKNYNNINSIPKNIFNKYILGCIEYSNDLTKIITMLREIILEKETTNKKLILENKIKRELKKLHFNFNYIGVRYLVDCILIIYTRNLEKINLRATVYPILENKYKKSSNTIKGNMTHAIKMMYYECEETTLLDFFGYLDMSKPTLKEVITTIIEKI